LHGTRCHVLCGSLFHNHLDGERAAFMLQHALIEGPQHFAKNAIQLLTRLNLSLLIILVKEYSLMCLSVVLANSLCIRKI